MAGLGARRSSLTHPKGEALRRLGLPAASLACLLGSTRLASAQVIPDSPPPANEARVPPVRASGRTASPDASALQDVIVTARRRAETLQKVPVTVSAFDARRLDQLQVRDTTDLSGKSPNVQITAAGSGTGALQVFIRGIGQDALGFNVENPVGVYLDDVYLGRVQGALLDLLDFDRIEVLRGPQGTLYGRNSTVGALKYVTKDPDLETAHYKAGLTLGDFNRVDSVVGLSLPIIKDQLGVKIDVGTRRQDGYLDVVDATGAKTGGHENNIDRQTVRASVLWVPDSRLRVDASADYGRDVSGSTEGTPIMVDAKGASTPVFGSPYKVGDNGADTGGNRSYGVSGRIQYALDGVTLKSITAYRSVANHDIVDLTGLPDEAAFVLPDAKNQHQLSQELQAVSTFSGPLKVIGGVFYYNENIVHDDDFIGIARNIDHQVSDSVAGYADATLALTSRLNLSLGGRYSYDHKSIDRRILDETGAGLFAGSDAFSSTKFTYKVGADYTFARDILGYVTYSTGYRPGTFVYTYPFQPQIAAGVVLNATRTETAENVEVGLKTELFSHRLRLNGDLFHTDYTGLQSAGSTLPFPIISKNVRLQGAELEFDARPLPGLSLYGGAGYLDSLVTAGLGTGGSPRYSPHWQASFGGEYRRPVSAAVNGFAGGNVVYTSSFRTDDTFGAAVDQSAYALVGAHVGADFAGGKYVVTFEVRNLTDKAYFVSTNAGSTQYYAAPRNFFATVAVRY